LKKVPPGTFFFYCYYCYYRYLFAPPFIACFQRAI